MNILKNKEAKSNKKIFKKILLVFLVIILIAIGIFAYRVYKNGGGLQGFLATAIGHDENTVKNLGKIYCLLLGQSEGLTDTIIVAAYDPEAQQASMLSIPRDTFVGTDITNPSTTDKINSVCYYRGIDAALEKINSITGLNIKYYLKIDTAAFREVVDTIGGVTFNVPIDMKYDDNRQNLHINLKAGEQLLDGDKAEQVVRFRHNNDGTTYPYTYGIEDFGRMKTQRAFLTALAKQTLKVENLFKINSFIDIADKYVETNLDFNAIKDYVPYIVKFNTDNLQTEQLPGESVRAESNGLWIYEVYKNETAKVVDEMFLNPEINEKIDTSGIDTTGINKAEVKIEILNGSDSDVKLERIKSRLENAGYENFMARDISETRKYSNHK